MIVNTVAVQESNHVLTATITRKTTMLKIEMGDVINEWQSSDSMLVLTTSVMNPFTGGLPKIIKTLQPFVYECYKENKINFTLGASIIADSVVIGVASKDKVHPDYNGLISVMQAARTQYKMDNKPLVIAMPEVGDKQRIIAIMEAVFYDVNATLYLKE